MEPAEQEVDDYNEVMQQLVLQVNSQFLKLGYPPIAEPGGQPIRIVNLIRNCSTLLDEAKLTRRQLPWSLRRQIFNSCLGRKSLATMEDWNSCQQLLTDLQQQEEQQAEQQQQHQQEQQEQQQRQQPLNTTVLADSTAAAAIVDMVTRDSQRILHQFDNCCYGNSSSEPETIEEKNFEEFVQMWNKFCSLVTNCFIDNQQLKSVNLQLQQYTAEHSAAGSQAGKLRIGHSNCTTPEQQLSKRQKCRVAELQARLRRQQMEMQRRERSALERVSQLEKENEKLMLLLSQRAVINQSIRTFLPAATAAASASQAAKEKLSSREKQLGDISSTVAKFATKVSIAVGNVAVEAPPESADLAQFVQNVCNYALDQLMQLKEQLDTVGVSVARQQCGGDQPQPNYDNYMPTNQEAGDCKPASGPDDAGPAADMSDQMVKLRDRIVHRLQQHSAGQ